MRSLDQEKDLDSYPRNITRGVVEEWNSSITTAAVYNFQQFPLIYDVHYSDMDNRYLASVLAPQIQSALSQVAFPERYGEDGPLPRKNKAGALPFRAVIYRTP